MTTEQEVEPLDLSVRAFYFSPQDSALPDTTYEEGDESVGAVLAQRLSQTVAPQTQLVVAVNVAHLHQPDQPRLLH